MSVSVTIDRRRWNIRGYRQLVEYIDLHLYNSYFIVLALLLCHYVAVISVIECHLKVVTLSLALMDSQPFLLPSILVGSLWNTNVSRDCETVCKFITSFRYPQLQEKRRKGTCIIERRERRIRDKICVIKIVGYDLGK